MARRSVAVWVACLLVLGGTWLYHKWLGTRQHLAVFNSLEEYDVEVIYRDGTFLLDHPREGEPLLYESVWPGHFSVWAQTIVDRPLVNEDVCVSFIATGEMIAALQTGAATDLADALASKCGINSVQWGELSEPQYVPPRPEIGVLMHMSGTTPRHGSRSTLHRQRVLLSRVGIVANWLSYLSVIILLVSVERWCARTRRRDRGECQQCGYTLYRTSQCPECGTPWE